MTQNSPRKVVIPKESAVFWMDREGNWHNEHGKFEHPKITRFFHKSIQKDGEGYFVAQATDEFEEKVYFRYEDTALFVFNIAVSDQIYLNLNTEQTLILDPENLVQKDDSLYVRTTNHLIKFSQKALVKISKYLEEKEDQLYLSFNDSTWEIKT